MDEKEIEWKREDYRAGIGATMIGNCSGFRDKDSRVFEPADFFPSLPRWGKKRESRITSDAANKAAIKMMMAQRKVQDVAQRRKSGD